MFKEVSPVAESSRVARLAQVATLIDVSEEQDVKDAVVKSTHPVRSTDVSDVQVVPLIMVKFEHPMAVTVARLGQSLKLAVKAARHPFKSRLTKPQFTKVRVCSETHVDMSISRSANELERLIWRIAVQPVKSIEVNECPPPVTEFSAEQPATVNEVNSGQSLIPTSAGPVNPVRSMDVRDGQLFNAMLAKFGIPEMVNESIPVELAMNCDRELASGDRSNVPSNATPDGIVMEVAPVVTYTSSPT